eukprot:1136286-Pelagomonas_calceolata.AAC.3
MALLLAVAYALLMTNTDLLCAGSIAGGARLAHDIAANFLQNDLWHSWSAFVLCAQDRLLVEHALRTTLLLISLN